MQWLLCKSVLSEGELVESQKRCGNLIPRSFLILEIPPAGRINLLLGGQTSEF
jgi:hypothetical protein